MKKREPAGEGRDRRQRIRPLAAAAIAVILAATAIQIPGVTARAAVDLNEDCSLTVSPSAEQGYLEDLGDRVVIDLYKVADAEEVPGYDTYGYKVKEAYGQLGGYLAQESLPDLDNETWRQMAQEAAGTALGDGSGNNGLTPDVTGAGTEAPITGEENGKALKPGLYLLVARDADAVPGTYTTRTIKETGADGQTEESVAQIVTEVRTERYTYTFSPELISLPGKAPDENGQVSTDAPGPWLYRMSVTLKPGREERYGSLEIVKTLQSYETKDPATFVFQVDAYLDRDGDGEEENVFSDVVSMTFTDAGQQRVTLAEKILVGARVVVTEVYSGSSYTVSGEQTQEGTLRVVDELLSMEFTNTYDGHNRGGHGIENSFTYSATDGWSWTQGPGGAQ